MTRRPLPTVMAFLALTPCLFWGQSRADERACLQSPTAACIGALAAQHAKALVRSKFWRAITRDLVLAGRADDAEALAGNLSDPWDKMHLEQNTAILKVAADARAAPAQAASLQPILGLGEFRLTSGRTFSRYDRMSSSFHLLALELLGEQPFSRGARPWLVEAESAHAGRHRPPSNATLQVVLRAWQEIVDKTEPHQRAYLRVQLANAYSTSRQFEEARGILQSLDQNTPILGGSLLLVRAWLRAGDPGRAVAVAAKEIDIERFAEGLAEIASTYFSLGRRSEALNIVALGFASLDQQLADPAAMQTHAGAVKAYVALSQQQLWAGDKAGAAHRLEELARLAERPDMLQPFNLVAVATMFNDLKQFARARSLLDRALAAIPPADRTVALGFHAGPIRYDPSGLGGEAIQRIAVELYRAGDSSKAVGLIKQLGSPYRLRACIDVVRGQLVDSSKQFDLVAFAEAIDLQYASELLLVASAFEVKVGDIAEARTLFQRALKARESGLGVDGVRMAALLGDSTFVATALRSSLKDALAFGDADSRTLHLASLAAAARAALPR